jgi:phosphohistidine phosphatase
MGEILKNLKVAPDLLISSPANRAATTARIIAEAIDYPIERIQYSEAVYLSGKTVLTDIIEHINDVVKVAMLIGHNPGFTDLANYISDRYISDIPTCGVCCVESKISSWAEIGEHCGKLKFFEFPKRVSS